MTAPSEWKSGGSEPLVWTHKGQIWAAVWAAREGYTGWVSGPKGRVVMSHPTEDAARLWCESVVGGVTDPDWERQGEAPSDG